MTCQCSRSGCGEPAAASLSFDYADRTAWLLDDTRPHPATYALCRRHADGLKVPVGWTLQDQRTPVRPLADGAQAS